MISDWPRLMSLHSIMNEAKMMSTLMGAFVLCVILDREMGVVPSRKTPAIVATANDSIAKMFVDGSARTDASVSSLETKTCRRNPVLLSPYSKVVRFTFLLLT